MSDAEGTPDNRKEQLFKRSKDRALVCLNKKEYSRAFAHFLIAITLKPEIEDEFLNLLLYTLGILSNELEVGGNYQELFSCYEQALEILPNNSQILHGLATVLFRLGHVKTATAYFKMAYRENPYFTPSLYSMDSIKSSLVERWHFMMLNDKKRNTSFAEAIKKAVESGCRTVLDIGAGTGILSLIAVDAGAEKVYACEGNDVMFQVLNSVVDANKKNIVVLNKLSHDIKIPEDITEKVDLIITEIFDAGVFGEHALKTLCHAWKHLIKNSDANMLSESGEKKIPMDSENSADVHGIDNAAGMRRGRVLPSSVVMWAVPIECEHVRQYVRLSPEAFDLFGMKSITVSSSTSASEPYTTEKLADLQCGYKYLSAPKQLLEVNFDDLEEMESLLKGKMIKMTFDCQDSGEIDGIAVWFDLFLDEEIKISTQPGSDCCWEQAVFPLSDKFLQGKSHRVITNDLVEVCFKCEGHLSLLSVSTPHEVQCINSITLNPEVISQMNQIYANRTASVNFSSLYADSGRIVDISDIPLIGFKFLLEGATKLTVLPSKHLMDMNSIMNAAEVMREKLRVMSYEEFCSQPFECDMLITEPVEMCGLLKKNIFEDIAFIRSLQEKSLHILPQKIGIYAILIDSPELQRQSRVLSDDQCLGHKIAEFMNIYKCNIHQDLQINAIHHNKLCDPVKLMNIDLQKLTLEPNQLQSFVTFTGSTTVKVVKSGTVSAIPYWFDLDYGQDFVLDTSAPGTQFRQAAVLLDTGLDVKEGNEIALEWTCRNSCLNISIEKC